MSTTSRAGSVAARRDLLQWGRGLVRALQQFLTPPTVTPEGNCPRCGQPVERGLIPGMTRSADEPAPAVPWHLKLLGSALALYLGYRVLQLIDWLIHRSAH